MKTFLVVPHVNPGQILPQFSSYCLPYRIIGIPPLSEKELSIVNSANNTSVNAFSDDSDFSATSLQNLGILDSESLTDNQSFPFIKGSDEADWLC